MSAVVNRQKPPKAGRRVYAFLEALSLAAALFVIGLVSVSSEAESAGQWKWGTGTPGMRIAVPDMVATAARDGGIDGASIRELASAGSGSDRFALLAGRRGSSICFAFATAATTTQFNCLEEHAEAGKPVVYSVRTTGSVLDIAEASYVVGVARNDVGRVAVELANGSVRSLPLNGWRAFAYAARSQTEIPTELRVESKADTTLADESLR